MSRYVKKPVEIQAVQVIRNNYKGSFLIENGRCEDEDFASIKRIRLSFFNTAPDWLSEAIEEERIIFDTVQQDDYHPPLLIWEERFLYAVIIKIKTLEGKMFARLGDYIIKGVEGEIYPCKESIFNKTYNKVENE